MRRIWSWFRVRRPVRPLVNGWHRFLVWAIGGQLLEMTFDGITIARRVSQQEASRIALELLTSRGPWKGTVEFEGGLALSNIVGESDDDDYWGDEDDEDYWDE